MILRRLMVLALISGLGLGIGLAIEAYRTPEPRPVPADAPVDEYFVTAARTNAPTYLRALCQEGTASITEDEILDVVARDIDLLAHAYGDAYTEFRDPLKQLESMLQDEYSDLSEPEYLDLYEERVATLPRSASVWPIRLEIEGVTRPWKIDLREWSDLFRAYGSEYGPNAALEQFVRERYRTP
ncbi:MAG: hypothetical protein KDC38_03435 [Planctomycetes bacterium]|nr:hypothetical protein [Planctomycetota bacterium]